MKVGDLVVIVEKHRSVYRPGEHLIGVIVEHFPAEGYLEESVHVLWSGQEQVTVAFANWLEVINESRNSS